MSIWHSEASWYNAQRDKSYSLVQMKCMYICRYYSIELEYAKTFLLRHGYAVKYELFTYVLTADISSHGITCIAYMTASSHVIWVEYVEPYNLPILCVLGDSGICLLLKKCISCLRGQVFLLWK